MTPLPPPLRRRRLWMAPFWKSTRIFENLVILFLQKKMLLKGHQLKKSACLNVSVCKNQSIFEWSANKRAVFLKNGLILFWRFGEFVELWNELITWKSSWCALIPKRWTFNIRLASWGYTESIFTRRSLAKHKMALSKPPRTFIVRIALQ